MAEMQNQALQQGVEIIAYCGIAMKQALDFNLTLYHLAKWAFILAISLAVLSTVVDLIIKYRVAMKEADKEKGDDENAALGGAAVVTPDLLNALKDLLESLAKLPVWFALFLGGAALVWLSTNNMPSVCEPKEATKEAPKTPPAPADKAAPKEAAPAKGS
jgi:hypothetical protein